MLLVCWYDGMMMMRSVLDLAGEDGVELLLGDESVVVGVGAVDELLQLLLGDVLAELLGDPAQVLDGDEAGALVVVEGESYRLREAQERQQRRTSAKRRAKEVPPPT